MTLRIYVLPSVFYILQESRICSIDSLLSSLSSSLILHKSPSPYDRCSSLLITWNYVDMKNVRSSKINDLATKTNHNMMKLQWNCIKSFSLYISRLIFNKKPSEHRTAWPCLSMRSLSICLHPAPDTWHVTEDTCDKQGTRDMWSPQDGTSAVTKILCIKFRTTYK